MFVTKCTCVLPPEHKHKTYPDTVPIRDESILGGTVHMIHEQQLFATLRIS
jgi:hypothetical protein